MPSETVWSDYTDPGISIFRGFKGVDKPKAYVRLIDDGDAPVRTDPLLFVRDDEDGGTAPSVVITGAGSSMDLGAEWPPSEWGTPVRQRPKLFVTLDGAPAAQNLVEMRGTTNGQYALIITDGCGIFANGQISANDRWSPTNGVNPLIGGRPYGLGAASDWNQTAELTSALVLAESNHDDLDFFQGFKLNDTHWRFRLLDTGGMWWGIGSTITPYFRITPVGGTGLQFGAATTERVGFFGAAPVVQQSAPSNTLGEVLTALRNLGLLA